MAETNSDAPAADDSKPTTEDDIRAIKYPEDGVEDSKEADEPTDGDEDKEESKEAEDDSQEDSKNGEDSDKEEEPAFVKKFSNIKGDTPEEYAKNLEAAYENSTAEFHKLRQSTPAPKEDDEESSDGETPSSDPLLLYTKQKMDEEIGEAFKDFSSRYTQVADPVEYDRFVEEVKVLSQTIYTSQKRLASPKELYAKAAVLLGWDPTDKVTDKERLDSAVKGTASSSKTSSGPSKKVTKSKVTDAQVATHKAMFPGKTDSQIREELESYVT